MSLSASRALFPLSRDFFLFCFVEQTSSVREYGPGRRLLACRYSQGDKKSRGGSADVTTLCGVRAVSVRYNGDIIWRGDPARGGSRVSWLLKIYFSGGVGPRIQVVHASHAVLIHGCSTYIVQPSASEVSLA